METVADTDTSHRFLLPADSALTKNLAALWNTNSAVARQIDAVDDTTHLLVAPSRSGKPTLAATTDSGRQIYLHSRYDPIAEAKQLAETIATDQRAIFRIHGLGLGYHLDALFERLNDEAQVFVFEPDLAILRVAFEVRDFSQAISYGRVHFVVSDDKPALHSLLLPHSASLSLGFEALRHPASIQRFPAFHESIEQSIREFDAYAKTSLNTLVLNGKRTAENVARNIGWYASSPGISRLRNAYAGQPAIIVSAGPSLRKNKHLLKDVDGKAAIIAVQTTLQPLLEAGIEPDFVTTLDYHDISTRFYERLPRDCRTELIAEVKASPKIFTMHPGPLTLAGNDYADKLLAGLKLDRPKLPSGATVAHLSFYLAEFLGCDPIIFIGQDLGFSDGLCYLPGTSYDDVWRPELNRFQTLEMKQWEQIVRDRPILRKVRDYQNNPTYTEERLFTYLQHFERDFARTKARVIDATEGGVLKRGASVMTLASAITQFCTRELTSTAAHHSGKSGIHLDAVLACLCCRKDEAVKIERISQETLPLLREVRDHLDDQSRVNRAIARIDPLRARMNELSGCYELVTQLMQDSELKKFTADRNIAAAKLDGTERQRRQVQRDIDNVESIIEAAIAFQALMNDSMDRVRAMQPIRQREAA